MNWIKDFDGNQQMTKEDVIEGLAQMARQAGMPRERVEACSNDEKNLAAVDANWQEGQTRYNVGSTPTFIWPISGRYFATGSLICMRPSSTSIMAATETIGLVME